MILYFLAGVGICTIAAVGGVLLAFIFYWVVNRAETRHVEIDCRRRNLVEASRALYDSYKEMEHAEPIPAEIVARFQQRRDEFLIAVKECR